MHNEQVFTPNKIVDLMLSELEYKDGNIRKRHIMDNSCGDGAFLISVVRKYINACVMNNLTKEETIKELETYIHGIEIDGELVRRTIINLDKVAEEYSLGQVKWDIVWSDAMDRDDYYGKMDYVVGNPPYCRVHDLGESYDKVKGYKFANGGMTDLYLVFFELGINMLNNNGKLAYITPNSWLNSLAGTNFRNYLKESHTLLEIIQFGSYKVFENVGTYTCITFLSKTPKSNNIFVWGEYLNEKEKDIHLGKTKDYTLSYAENPINIRKYSVMDLDKCMIDGKIYLAKPKTLEILSDIDEINKKMGKDRYRVKNGFATLNDKLFDVTEYVNNDERLKIDRHILRTFKASNGEKKYFFYPYDKNGKQVTWDDVSEWVKSIMLEKAEKLNVDTNKEGWFYYGRTQAINDVKCDKVILNNLIRSYNDIKVDILMTFKYPRVQNGVYSGYYVPIKDGNFKRVIDYIWCDEFVEYVKAVGKYKNNGYYTFSTKDVEKWINYCYYNETKQNR